MKACYTVITSNYDSLKPIKYKTLGWDYICFTDNDKIKSNDWKIVLLDNYDNLNSKKLSRRPKLLSHEYLPQYDTTIYIDASYEVIGDLNSIIIPDEVHFVLARHPTRKCIYEELQRVLELKCEDADLVNNIENRYRQLMMPVNYGLTQNGVIFRRNTAFTQFLNRLWWNEVEKYSYRDQLSLMYLVYKYDILKNIKFGIITRLASKVFNLHRHTKHVEEDFRLFEFVPYGVNKNIGKAINEHCELVPDGSWICIRDRDTAWLTSDYGDQVRECIKRYPDTALFSCFTNRLGLTYQLISGKIDDNADYRHHVKLAEELQAQYGSECIDIVKPVAGFCMIFSKEWWSKQRFDEGSIIFDGKYFDWRFSEGILQKGGKIRLMRGVYLWHEYRINHQTATSRPYLKHIS